jgi:hypothetical protein
MSDVDFDDAVDPAPEAEDDWLDALDALVEDFVEDVIEGDYQ